MNAKAARALRRKVSWLVKGKLREFIGLEKMAEGVCVLSGGDHSGHVPACESTVTESVLLYWVRDIDCYRNEPYASIAGYECGAGGVGRCLFSIWWVDSEDSWDYRIASFCPPVLARELENLIEEVSDEEKSRQG